MIRDSLKNVDYYNKYIDSEKKRIDKFSKALSALKEGTPQYAQCKMYLSNIYRNIINAAYSKGCDKDEIRLYVEKYFRYFDFDKQSGYADIIDALAFVIIFDLKVVDITKISCNDSLIYILCNYISSNEVKKSSDYNLKYYDLYHSFIDVLCDKISCDDFISFIKNDWYELNKDMHWFDSHKSDKNIYNGYWCWLGGAVLKMLNYPINRIVDCEFIPKDVL